MWANYRQSLALAQNIYMFTWDKAIFCKLTKRNCEKNKRKTQTNKTQKYNISEHQLHKIANKHYYKTVICCNARSLNNTRTCCIKILKKPNIIKFNDSKISTLSHCLIIKQTKKETKLYIRNAGTVVTNPSSVIYVLIDIKSVVFLLIYNVKIFAQNHIDNCGAINFIIVTFRVCVFSTNVFILVLLSVCIPH